MKKFAAMRRHRIRPELGIVFCARHTHLEESHPSCRYSCPCTMRDADSLSRVAGAGLGGTSPLTLSGNTPVRVAPLRVSEIRQPSGSDVTLLQAEWIRSSKALSQPSRACCVLFPVLRTILYTWRYAAKWKVKLVPTRVGRTR